MKRFFGLVLLMIYILAAIPSCTTPRKVVRKSRSKKVEKVHTEQSDKYQDEDSMTSNVVMGFYPVTTVKRRVRKIKRKSRSTGK